MVTNPRHKFDWWRWLRYLVCRACGPVRLKNDITDRAVRAGCEQ